MSVSGFVQKAGTSLYHLNECHHVDPCSCVNKLANAPLEYTELLASHRKVEMENKANMRELSSCLEQVRDLEETAESNRERNNIWGRNKPTTERDYWEKSPDSPESPNFSHGSSSFGTRSLDDDRIIAMLENERNNLSSQLNVQTNSFRKRIQSLEAQLTYAQRDGNSVQVREELDALKAKEKTQQKNILALNNDLMHAVQQLNYEKNNHSLKCKNEAACSTKIRELEEQKTVLIKGHEDNDLMVQDAAMQFGKSPEGAQHYTLKTYLQEITEAMIRQIASGKLISTGDKQIFSSILGKVNEQRMTEITEYKNRLEIEVQRLGGDVKTMRLGLDPRRPPPHRDLPYEGNAAMVYNIYQILFAKVEYLTNLIKEHDYKPVAWVPDKPRSDFFNSPEYNAQDWIDPKALVKIKNPRYEDNEVLLQTLLRSEISRLVNRGVELKTFVAHEFRGDGTFFNEKVTTPLKETENVVKTALHHTHDDLRPIEKRSSDIEDTELAARAERRYRIWRAMQITIAALTLAIKSFNSVAPPWSTNPLRPQPRLVFRKSFEALATNLMKFEINTLEHRIDTLLDFMETNQLPGTTHGAIRVQGSPAYQADFDASRAALTYALLVKGHWADELISIPDVEKPIRLSLAHSPLLHAVLRKKGGVMVPKINQFSWAFTQGGKPLPEPVGLEKYNPNGNLGAGPMKMQDLEDENTKHYLLHARVKQLSECIIASRIPCTIIPPLWNSKPKSSMTLAYLQQTKPDLTKWEQELRVWMKDKGLKLPKLPQNSPKSVWGQYY